ncbi:MAG TPA: cytochrome c3 family protein [Anaerolineae bacterium]|nr:cytochrome c3 family protein [Anaerolineae bacterium]
MSKQTRLIKRQHPLFSPISIITTIIFLLALGLSLRWRGGHAFSPGPLSTSAVTDRQTGGFDHHADFADNCTLCHEPFVGVTNQKCTACHLLIADQINQATGLHTHFADQQCTTCHQEHLGPNHPLFDAAIAQFTPQHHQPIFPLNNAHAPLDCQDCHHSPRFDEADQQCASCHEEPAIHQTLFGLECQRCHTDIAWRPAELKQHTFPLDHGQPGQGEIPCQTCHTTTQLTQHTCTACHATDDMPTAHQNVSFTTTPLTACVACHATGHIEPITNPEG